MILKGESIQAFFTEHAVGIDPRNMSAPSPVSSDPKKPILLKLTCGLKPMETVEVVIKEYTSVTHALVETVITYDVLGHDDYAIKLVRNEFVEVAAKVEAEGSNG